MAELKRATPDVVETWINKALELVFTGRLGNSYEEISHYVRRKVRQQEDRAVSVDPQLVKRLAEEAKIEVEGCERAVVDASVRKAGRSWPRHMPEIFELIDFDFHGEVGRTIESVHRVAALGNPDDLLRALEDYRQLELILGTEAARAVILQSHAAHPENGQ